MSGDPSVFGNLPPHPSAFEAVQKAAASGRYNGYAHSSGLPEARAAVAEEYSTTQHPLTAEVGQILGTIIFNVCLFACFFKGCCDGAFWQRCFADVI